MIRAELRLGPGCLCRFGDAAYEQVFSLENKEGVSSGERFSTFRKCESSDQKPPKFFADLY